MSLKAIDIASWQEGIVPSETDADIVIVKATGGTWYENPFFEQWVEDVLASGKILGIYHYAVESQDGPDARAEAEFFLSHVRRYRGRFVPVLDWEANAMDLPQEWAVEWMDVVAAELGATPMFYAYASHLNSKDYSKVAAKYPLWMASYLDRYAGAGWVGDPVNVWDFGSWDSMLMYQYTESGRISGYGGGLDLSAFYGTREDWQRMTGGDMGKLVMLNDVAARIHYDMVTDPRNGYNQQPVRWGGNWGGDKTLGIDGKNYTYALGDYDCSSSTITAWRLALKGTPYEGALDGASYTGDMEEVFLASGLFYAELSPARRGDLYLNAGDHVAMCQDGGSDGVYGFDSLSEFNRNELHQASWGDPGDQDGYESVFRAYYDRPWETVLHYNHKADYYLEEKKEEIVVPTQPQTDPKNGYGLEYRAHVQTAGWMPMVRDGQTAGSEGYGKRLEAIQVIPPEGMVIDLYTHEQGYGNRFFDAIRRGVNEPVVGTVGEGRRMEAFMARVTVRPKGFEGKTLMMQAHMQGIGWMDPVPEGQWAGIRFQGKRLEAVRMWFE